MNGPLQCENAQPNRIELVMVIRPVGMADMAAVDALDLVVFRLTSVGQS